jgi:hypothetical protein
MTYVDPAARARAYRSVPALLAAGEGPAGGAATYQLPVPGQGTIGFAIAKSAPFTLTARGAPGSPALRWTVGS